MRRLRQPNAQLWIAQVFLAVFFALGSGLPKLILSEELLAANMPIPLPHEFVLFIGTCEILGALGLILPGVTRRGTVFTPLAAFGLVLLTACATTYQLMAGQPGSAVFASVMGLLCAYVAIGRWRGVATSRVAVA